MMEVLKVSVLQCWLQAIDLAPTKAMPHVACCISMGRLAVFSDNKAKVRAWGRPILGPAMPFHSPY
jgi:hypothetical protein